MESEIMVRRDQAIAEIRFNRPAKKNALTAAMYGGIARAIEEFENDPAVKAILFSAEGDIFCAGNDLADFAAFARGDAGSALDQVEDFLRNLVMARKPVIAAVSGDGVGVGATMLLHCDIVVIAEDARLTMPFTALGLTPEAASSLLLPQIVGHARAYAMLALGQPMTGAEAARSGLAAIAAPRSDVEREARRLASGCCARPPEAMRITKSLLRDRQAILARIEQEGAHFKDRLASAEAKAAFAAFLNR